MKSIYNILLAGLLSSNSIAVNAATYFQTCLINNTGENINFAAIYKNNMDWKWTTVESGDTMTISVTDNDIVPVIKVMYDRDMTSDSEIVYNILQSKTSNYKGCSYAKMYYFVIQNNILNLVEQ